MYITKYQKYLSEEYLIVWKELVGADKHDFPCKANNAFRLISLNKQVPSQLYKWA
jgi:hypothetical protein